MSLTLKRPKKKPGAGAKRKKVAAVVNDDEEKDGSNDGDAVSHSQLLRSRH